MHSTLEVYNTHPRKTQSQSPPYPSLAIFMDPSKQQASSDFSRHEQTRSEEIQRKISQMNSKIAEELSKGPRFLHSRLNQLSEHIQLLQNSQVTSETWIHIDMDMFYAAIEIRDDPFLSESPVAVGNERVIATSNYIARQFGVKSAMPTFKAQRLCPDLILVPSELQKYKRESQKLREIFTTYDPDHEMVGLDEAYLLVTHMVRPPRSGEQIASEIREQILRKLRLTASAGIGCNRLLAKLSSDMNKPNGQYSVLNEDIRQFMSERKVRDIPGVGEVFEKLLHGIGIQKCSDILKKKLELSLVLNQEQNDFLLRSALGMGKTTHVPKEKQVKKSMSASKTIDPTDDSLALDQVLTELVHKLSGEMVKAGVKAKVFQLSVKTKDYQTEEAQEGVRDWINDSTEIILLMRSLLRQTRVADQIRCITVKAMSLCYTKKAQSSLVRPKKIFDPAPIRKKKVSNRGNNEFLDLFASFSGRTERRSCPHCAQSFRAGEEIEKHLKDCQTGVVRRIESDNGMTLDAFFRKKM